MYSESNFNSFTEFISLLNSQKDTSEIKLAKDYAKNKLTQAEDSSKNLFNNVMLELEKEIEDLKIQKIIAIEMNYTRKRHLLVKKFTYKIKNVLKNRLTQEFDYLSECFLKKITNQFETGNLIIYKKFTIPNLEKFDISYSDEKKIIFTKQNKYIEFSVELILREYQEIIKEKIVKYLGE